MADIGWESGVPLPLVLCQSMEWGDSGEVEIPVTRLDKIR